jgi:spermidine synthase
MSGQSAIIVRLARNSRLSGSAHSSTASEWLQRLSLNTSTALPCPILVLAFVWALNLCVPAVAGEKLLLERKSPYNTIVVTEDDRGMRILRFEQGGARQSVVKLGDPDHLELPYVRAIPVALVFVEKPHSVLVVGLGGGTIPGFLRKHFPDLRIDVVEIDPGVAEVARSHFGFREDAGMHAYVADGRQFIERSGRLYDIIFLDAYGADSVPYQLVTREFLSGVRRALAPGGVVVGNIWGRESNPLYDSMVRTYQAVYDEVSTIDAHGANNKIVVASLRKRAFSKAELVRRSGELTRQLVLRSDLGDIVDRGYRRVDAEGGGGHILTDAGGPDLSPGVSGRVLGRP